MIGRKRLNILSSLVLSNNQHRGSIEPYLIDKLGRLYHQSPLALLNTRLVHSGNRADSSDKADPKSHVQNHGALSNFTSNSQ
jgi:hypothetical protein